MTLLRPDILQAPQAGKSTSNPALSIGHLALTFDLVNSEYNSEYIVDHGTTPIPSLAYLYDPIRCAPDGQSSDAGTDVIPFNPHHHPRLNSLCDRKMMHSSQLHPMKQLLLRIGATGRP